MSTETMPSGTPIDDVGPITLGEVYRHLLSFEGRTMAEHKALDDRLAQALGQMVPREVWSIEHMELESRMAIIERGRRDATNFERAIMVALVGSIATGAADIIFRLVS